MTHYCLALTCLNVRGAAHSGAAGCQAAEGGGVQERGEVVRGAGDGGRTHPSIVAAPRGLGGTRLGPRDKADEY